MKITFILMIILVIISSIQFSFGNNNIETLGYSVRIINIDHPQSVVLGERIPMDITIEHYLMHAWGYTIFVYPSGKYDNPWQDAFIDRSTIIFPKDIERSGGSWLSAGTRELSESVHSIIYPFPDYASHEVKLTVEVYVNLRKNHLVDSSQITIFVESDKNWGLVVNGGFENGALGWTKDNRSGTASVTTGGEVSETGVKVWQSPCIKICNYKKWYGTPIRTGIEQTIPNTIFDKDTRISFKTKLNTYSNVYHMVLTQLSVVFEDDYRINYVVVAQEQHQDPLYYEKVQADEANILVSEPTLNWQHIDRDLKLDFVNAFGIDALRPFDYATVIVEQASYGMYHPVIVYFDDIAINELTSVEEITPQEELEVSEETTEEITEVLEEPEIKEQEEMTSQIQLPSFDMTFIGIIAIVCIIIGLLASTIYLQKSKREKVKSRQKSKTQKRKTSTKTTQYCIDCRAKIPKNSKFCKECGKNQ